MESVGDPHVAVVGDRALEQVRDPDEAGDELLVRALVDLLGGTALGDGPRS